MMYAKRLIVSALITILSVNSVFAADFTDVQKHWAKDEILKWSDKGILSGYDGAFNPNAPLTRGEMAIILDRIFQYNQIAENRFDDLPNQWYTDAILKINKKGHMQGYNNKIRPLDAITRQEATVLLCKGFNIKPESVESDFKDYDTIASWAKDYVNAMNKLGYISGKPDGKFHPNEIITRAETIKIMDNILGGYFYKNGEYSQDIQGVVIVNTPDVILKDMTVQGDLFVTEGVGEGDFTLDNVNVTGEMFVYGGGVNSIKLYNTSVGKITIDKPDSKIRIVSDQDLGEIVLEKNTHLIIDGDMSVKDVKANDNSELVVTKDAKVETLNIEGRDVKTVVDGNVEHVNVVKDAKNTTITGEGQVNRVINEAQDKDLEVDAVTGASQQEKKNDSSGSGSNNGSSSGGNSGSNSGSSSGGSSSGGGNTPQQDSFSYSVSSPFLGSPITNVTVYKNNGMEVGYTLYVGGEKVAKDSDNDGKISAANSYFLSNSKVEYQPKNKTEKVTITKR